LVTAQTVSRDAKQYKARRFLDLPSVGVQASDQCTADNIRFFLTTTFKDGVKSSSSMDCSQYFFITYKEETGNSFLRLTDTRQI